MSKTCSRLFPVVAGAIALLPSTAWAADATDTFVASVTITDAFSITCTDLNFGTVIRPGGYIGGYSIQLDPTTGVATPEGTLLHSNDATRASCGIQGETGNDATIVLAATGATWGGGFLNGVPMTNASDETMYAYLGSSKNSLIGNETIYIGGSVQIATQTGHSAGTYTSGAVTVTLTD